MWTLGFWKDVGERALKTFVYTMLGALPVGAAQTSIVGVPWGTAAMVAASATVLSVLGSIGSMKLGSSGTASLTKAVEPAKAIESDPLY